MRGGACLVDADVPGAAVVAAPLAAFDNEADLTPLFGSAKRRKSNEEGARESGFAGRLLIDDAVMEIRASDVEVVDHNSIDRFTAGVRPRLLFDEEVIVQRADPNDTLVIKLQITILPPRIGAAAIADDILRAYWMAIDDLCHGRLAIGAKRHGHCEGKHPWPTAEKLIEAVGATYGATR